MLNFEMIVYECETRKFFCDEHYVIEMLNN